MMRTIAVILFSILRLTIHASAENLTIAERGKAAAYTIIIPAAASPSQQYAAEELQSFTEQMTGAKLPVLTDENPLPERAILLGATRYTEKLCGPLDLKTLGDDGFTLKTAGSHICIIGSDLRGTLYGVYELLEKHAGCRWFSSWHSRIPKLERWEIPELNNTQTPAFVVREPFWYDMFKGDFAARSRSNGNRPNLTEKHGGKIRFGSGMFVHTFLYLCPPDKYFDEHPEYFSMVKGKRLRNHSQLCLTNPDVLKIVTDATLERIRKDPTAKVFSVSQNDWRNPCECPECKAVDDKEGSHAGTMIHFVNKVAEAVEKEFPDIWIETLAYQYTRTPPKSVRPRHNVVPRLCTIECDFSLPLNVSQYKENRSFMEDISGWSKMTDKLFIWDYVTDFAHYIGPFPNVMALQGNIKVFRDNHVAALFEQGAYNGAHGEFAELKAWLISKLLWNPDQDLNVLIDDFMKGYYGAGAPYVKEYLFALHKLFEKPETHCRIFENISTKPEITDEFMSYAELLWSRAEAAVKDDPATLYNVRMSKIPVVYAGLQRIPQAFPEKPVITAEGYIKSVGAPAEYIDRATELITLLDESKERIFIREHAEHEGAAQRKLRSVVKGSEQRGLKAAALEASISEHWGGSVTELKLEGNNYISFTRGGINLYPSISSAREVSRKHFSVIKQSSELISIKAEGHDFDEERIYTADNGTLTISSTLTSEDSQKTITPFMRIPLNLGGAENIYWRSNSSEWKRAEIATDAICDTLPIPVEDIINGSIGIANAASQRSVKISFSGIEVEQCDIELDRNKSTVTLSLSAREQKADTATLVLKLTPSQTAEALTKEISTTPVRIVCEDEMMRLGKEGEWCVRVKDSAAVNHSAIKLLNTHYEWCTSMHFEHLNLESDMRYKLRMRVRVETKPGVIGEALWAGVYDWKNKKSCGQVTGNTDSFKEGKYIWLDVAEWIPTETHYFWIGPGRFDKEKGSSAIEALYIDRIELLKLQ